MTIIAFIVTIGIIVIVHEFGHFCAARLTGMRVKKFSIGFPPRMMSRQIGKTEFTIGWIPLGGYVQIAGMVDESLDGAEITGAPDEFLSKNLLQKVFALSAGVLLNYLTAFLIIAGLAAVLGIGVPAGTLVGEVLSDMPAQIAGVVSGDEIIAVNGQAVDSWDSLVKVVSTARDTVHLVVRRATGAEESMRLPTRDAG
ncbi:MAG: site-2 protease family protein, partial [bacterium]|nr:site-2 protease family protein [bacterium]